MKTFVLCAAVATLGVVGCSHTPKASRPSANELPYHQPGKRGPRPEPVDKASTQRDCKPTEGSATGGSGTPDNTPDKTCPTE